MFKKFLQILSGIIVAAVGGFVLLSLLSYYPTDTSWNTASDTVENMMGSGGAWLADILFQWFGLMAYLVSIALFVWGFIAIVQSEKIKGRVYLFIPALILGCWLLGADAAFDLSEETPKNGGYIGFYLYNWVPNHLWYVQLVGWIVVALCVVFSFKIPMMKITKWCGQGIWFLLCKCRRKEMEKPVLLKKVRLKRKPKKELVDTTSVPKPKKSDFLLPSVDLLNPVPPSKGHTISAEQMAKTSKELEQVLAQFRVGGHVVRANPGPVVTLYEFEPASGIKTSLVISLADDIAREMRVVSVRIAVVPGTNVIGIEMPNPKRETVYIREMIDHPKFKNHTGVLPLVLGEDIGGTAVFADLATMPHLLVAGTTGSGKSVAVNTMILSLLYRFSPAECRLILVDPKMVELSVYEGIPHLLTPVVTEAGKSVVALKWAVREMEDRYRAMSQLGVRNIMGYNQKLAEAKEAGKTITRRVQTGFDLETGRPVIEEQALDLTPLPYIVMIIDEMSDLMCQCGKEAEPLILRLAQMARAVGIHLILATQRPSVNVITGTIKANFPTRVSFQVQNKIDSRTILGEQGAEQLLGRGDMLYMPAGQKPRRIHGPFVSDDEVTRVVAHLKQQGGPNYVKAVIEEESNSPNAGGVPGVSGGNDLYDQAVAVVLRDRKPTTSYLQRQFRIGYNKAADLIDRMEAEGVISKPNVSGKREILVGDK